MNKTDLPNASAKAVNKGIKFWFTRSDFYVTGLNYVFARIGYMCIAVSIPFYLDEVCGYEKNGDDTPYQFALAPGFSFGGSLLYSLFV